MLGGCQGKRGGFALPAGVGSWKGRGEGKEREWRGKHTVAKLEEGGGGGGKRE